MRNLQKKLAALLFSLCGLSNAFADMPVHEVSSLQGFTIFGTYIGYDENKVAFKVMADGLYKASLDFTPVGGESVYFGTYVQEPNGRSTTTNTAFGPGFFNFNALASKTYIAFAGSFNIPEGSSIPYTLTVSAVPEPSTWAMLILGLGIVGYQLKRRQA